MTKTEKTLIDLCELVDAYFQMQQPIVRSAIESQLKEQTKQIVEGITNKKKKESSPSSLPLSLNPEFSKHEKKIKQSTQKQTA
jgi:hypothetical protein